MGERDTLAALLHDEYDDLLCRVFEDIDVPAHHDMPPEWWKASADRLLAAGVRVAPSPDAPGLREAILARPEWIGWDTIYCYWCDNTESEGHAPDCLYAALAAQSEEPTP